MRYQIEIDEKYEQSLLTALDFYMRLGMFQLDSFREMLLCGYFTKQDANEFLLAEAIELDEVDLIMEYLDAIKSVSGRTSTEFDGIRNQNVHLKAKTCYEIQNAYKEVKKSNCNKEYVFARCESVLGADNYNLSCDYVFNKESNNIKMSLSLEQWKSVVSALSAFLNFGIGNYEFFLKLFKWDVLTFKNSDLHDSYENWDELKLIIKKIEKAIPCNKDYMSVAMLDSDHILYKINCLIHFLTQEINKNTTLRLKDGDYYSFKYNGCSCCGIFISDGLGGAFFNQGKVIALASDYDIEQIMPLYDKKTISIKGDALLANETVTSVCSNF